MTRLEQEALAGLWVPIYFGKRFKIARLKKDKLRTQEESVERFDSLKEARVECKRRNQHG